MDLIKHDMDWYFAEMLHFRHNTDYIDALALLKSRGIEPSFRVKFKAVYWSEVKRKFKYCTAESKKLADKDWYAFKFAQLRGETGEDWDAFKIARLEWKIEK